MPCDHKIASSGGECFLCGPEQEPKQDAERLLALHKAIRTEKARRSLAEFLRLGWHVLEPTTPLDWGWHIQALCDHVQAMLDDQRHYKGDRAKKPRAQNAIVNVPPGTLKSRILSVYAPAWQWLHDPSWRLLALSSNPAVADRDADYSKQLIESSWYRDTFSIDWTIRGDKDAIRNFHNTEGGYRISRGLNAKVTGLRGDAIFVDDPNDVKDVSDVQLAAVKRNWEAAQSRVNDERTAVRVMIQQRTHEKDLTGEILNNEDPDAPASDWHHLVIPMEREAPKPCVSCKVVHGESFLGWRDPRAEGEVLQPERNTPEVIARMKRALGPYGYAGQGQQRPSPLGGGMFKRKWWRRYGADYLERTKSGRPKLDSCVISVDATFKEEGTSRMAIAVIGAKGPKRPVLDLWVGKPDILGAEKAIESMIAAHPYYSELLIEDKANGPALISMLSKKYRGVVPVKPDGGKVSRANAMVPEVHAGDVLLPEHAMWVEELIDEHASFPMGRYDDIVDALSQALNHMREMSAVERGRAMGRW